MIIQDFDMSMYDYYKACTKDNPKSNKIWHFWGKSIVREKFVQEVENFAGYLMSIGVKKGDNVILCLSNIPNAIVCFYGINRAGAIANIVHPLIPSDKLSEMVDQMKPKAIILFDEFYGKYADWIEKSDNKVVLCSASDYLPGLFKLFYEMHVHRSLTKPTNSNVVRYRDIGKYVAPSVEIRGEDIAVYMHSGGTCGKAKTVLMSNDAFNHLTDNIMQLHSGDNKDAMLMVLPIFHTYGLGICMHTMMCAGVRIVLMPKFKPKTACYLLERYKVTYIAGVPYMYAKMLACGKFKGRKIARLKACFCGGDKVSENTKVQFRDAMQKAGNNILLSEGYGLTEACVCAINTMSVYKPNSIGRPIPSMKFGIIDEQKNFLPPLEKGEIVISGTTLMKGYYDHSENNGTFFYDQQGVKWLRSGDLGYIDEDGNVYFTERLKRLVKISGVNVFPQEVERIVNDLECVQSCCLVETTLNGKTATKLYVVKDKSCLLSDKQIEERILDEIGRKLMKFSKPKVIEFIDKLPMTPIGKVDFMALQRMTK